MSEKYICEVCKKAYNSFHSLLRHKIHCQLGVRFYCADCGKTFTQRATLQQHINSAHLGLKCLNCSKILTSKEKYENHVEKCSARIPELTCSKCSKQFSSLSNLNKHVRAKHGDRSFRCDQCPAPYCEHSQLLVPQAEGENNHTTAGCDRNNAVNKKQERRSRFQCEICGVTLSYAHGLNRHYKIKHQGVRFKCTHCTREFGTKANMRKHIMSDHELNKFYCKLCPRSYKQKGHLNNHIKTYHMNYQPYKCPTCKLVLQTEFDLQSHKIKQHNASSRDAAGAKAKQDNMTSQSNASLVTSVVDSQEASVAGQLNSSRDNDASVCSASDVSIVSITLLNKRHCDVSATSHDVASAQVQCLNSRLRTETNKQPDKADSVQNDKLKNLNVVYNRYKMKKSTQRALKHNMLKSKTMRSASAFGSHSNSKRKRCLATTAHSDKQSQKSLVDTSKRQHYAVSEVNNIATNQQGSILCSVEEREKRGSTDVSITCTNALDQIQFTESKLDSKSDKNVRIRIVDKGMADLSQLDPNMFSSQSNCIYISSQNRSKDVHSFQTLVPEISRIKLQNSIIPDQSNSENELDTAKVFPAEEENDPDTFVRKISEFPVPDLSQNVVISSIQSNALTQRSKSILAPPDSDHSKILDTIKASSKTMTSFDSHSKTRKDCLLSKSSILWSTNNDLKSLNGHFLTSPKSHFAEIGFEDLFDSEIENLTTLEPDTSVTDSSSDRKLSDESGVSQVVDSVIAAVSNPTDSNSLLDDLLPLDLSNSKHGLKDDCSTPTLLSPSTLNVTLNDFDLSPMFPGLNFSDFDVLPMSDMNT